MAELTRTEPERVALADRYRRLVRRGVAAALALAVLSIAEYLVTQALEDPTWFLIPFIVAKGAVILEIFMHLSDLWNDGEH